MTPAALSLSSSNAVGTLTLRKTGTDQHLYYISTNRSWVWMNPPHGSTQTITSETDQIVITAQPSGLAAGTYSAVVYIVESGAQQLLEYAAYPRHPHGDRRPNRIGHAAHTHSTGRLNAPPPPPSPAINRVGGDSDPDGDSEDRECHGQLECQH